MWSEDGLPCSDRKSSPSGTEGIRRHVELPLSADSKATGITLWRSSFIRCRVIYTTNAIESLNKVRCHAAKKRKAFPTEEWVKRAGRWSSSQPRRNGDPPKRLADDDEPHYYRIQSPSWEGHLKKMFTQNHKQTPINSFHRTTVTDLIY